MLVQQSIVAESLPTLLALTDKVSTVFHRVERENLLAGEHKAALEKILHAFFSKLLSFLLD